MSVEQMHKSGSVVVVESNESVDIWKLPLHISAASRYNAENGMKHAWLSSLSPRTPFDMDEGYLREP